MERRKCQKTFGISKYEKLDPEVKTYWNALYKLLEKEAAIPPDEKYQVLRKVFPDKLLNRIIQILSIPDAPKEQFTQEKSEHDAGVEESDKGSTKSVQLFMDKSKEDEKLVSEVTLGESDDTLCVNPPSTASLKLHYEGGGVADTFPEEYRGENQEKYMGIPSTDTLIALRKRAGRANPYLKFHKKSVQDAVIWGKPPPLLEEDKTLTQKAQEITEKIAAEFVAWLDTLGSDNTTKVEHICKMFEIGFNTHAAHSLCVKMVELPSVPEMVATAENVPHIATRAVLHRLIKEDIAAAKRKTKLFAFGGTLPMDMQIRPTKDNIARKWLHCEKVPPELRSMATVWAGITHLRSTRAFCEYLIDHPVVRPPKYLSEMGMLDPQYLRKVTSSLESGGSVQGSVNISFEIKDEAAEGDS